MGAYELDEYLQLMYIQYEEWLYVLKAADSAMPDAWPLYLALHFFICALRTTRLNEIGSSLTRET